MANLTWNVSPTHGEVPLTVVGMVNWTNVDTSLHPSIKIVWGDGTGDYFEPNTSSGSRSFIHTYNVSGIFKTFCELYYLFISQEPVRISNTIDVIVTITIYPPPPLPPPLPVFPPPKVPEEQPPITIQPPPPPEPPPLGPPYLQPVWPKPPGEPPIRPPIIIKPPTPPPKQPFVPNEPPIVPPKPPVRHPSHTDRSTMIAFIEKFGHRVGKWRYEVALDEGMEWPDMPEPYRSWWKFLTHHRIDVVFEYRNELYVAEVKPRLSITALGQAIIATDMFRMRYITDKHPRPAVICETASPLLLTVAGRNGVTIFLTLGVDGQYQAGIIHV